MRIFFPSRDALSAAELRAAGLDGELVPLGLGWVPADAVQTAELRAASLAPLLGTGLAAVAVTAAWVHGALTLLPLPYRAQRAIPGGARPVSSGPLQVRDALLPDQDQERRRGVRVSTPARTLVDLTAEQIAEPGRSAPRVQAIRLLASDRRTLLDAIALAERRPRMPRRPQILARLRAQDDVTRYTS